MKSFCKLLMFFFITLNYITCSTSSGVPNDINSGSPTDSFSYLSPEAIVHASTLSNLVSTFPKFQNQAINHEVSLLKNSITGYLNAVKTYNSTNTQEMIHKIENHYKKIQKLRKFLIKDDDEVLNRYLVKIKTTIQLLESSQNKIKETSTHN